MGFVHRHLIGGDRHDGDEPADVVGISVDTGITRT